METPALLNLAALGLAAVDGAALADIAAAALAHPKAEVLSASAAAVQMPVLNMTTGGLWRVQGTARPSGATPGPTAGAPFSAVVKLIQSPLLWSSIELVPPEMREELVLRYPWRTEAQVYASDLGEVMPDGGRLPEIFAIQEIDGERTAIWMEDVRECPEAAWTDATFAHAANWLGRLAGSSAVRSAGPAISAARDADRLRYFLDGVGSNVLIPGLQGEEIWHVPAVAETATPRLIAGLRSLAGRAYQLADEIVTLPSLPAHGDASPQNLLVESMSGGPGGVAQFAVIDWGMYGGACPGFDLGQLLSGWVNEGTMRGRELHRLEPLCLAAYCDGLAASGMTVPESVVRRGHALSMAIFTGLSAVASQRLGEPETDELHRFMGCRLEMAQFVVDLLEATD